MLANPGSVRSPAFRTAIDAASLDDAETGLRLNSTKQKPGFKATGNHRDSFRVFSVFRGPSDSHHSVNIKHGTHGRQAP